MNGQFDTHRLTDAWPVGFLDSSSIVLHLERVNSVISKDDDYVEVRISAHLKGTNASRAYRLKLHPRRAHSLAAP